MVGEVNDTGASVRVVFSSGRIVDFPLNKGVKCSDETTSTIGIVRTDHLLKVILPLSFGSTVVMLAAIALFIKCKWKDVL